MVIDFHTHNFPEKLAARAVAVMCEKLVPGIEASGYGPLRPVGDATVTTQLKDMDRCGVDICVNCPVCTYPENFDAIFRRAMAMREGLEGKAVAERNFQLGSVHPRDPEFREHIELLRANGVPGIKLHPNYEGVNLSDPGLFPFFEHLRDAGLFVISHTGFDPGYIDAPSVAGPKEVETLLKAVPGLKFVAAHLGGECGHDSHATDVLLQFENCWIDTAVMYFHDENPEAQRIIREWPADRMVFGTDYFWRDQGHLINWVKNLRPDPDDQEKIFHLNAERLLGLK